MYQARVKQESAKKGGVCRAIGTHKAGRFSWTLYLKVGSRSHRGGLKNECNCAERGGGDQMVRDETNCNCNYVGQEIV